MTGYEYLKDSNFYFASTVTHHAHFSVHIL